MRPFEQFESLTETLSQFGIALEPSSIPQVEYRLGYSPSDIEVSVWKGEVTVRGLNSLGENGESKYAYSKTWTAEGTSLDRLTKLLSQAVSDTILSESSQLMRQAERVRESAALVRRNERATTGPSELVTSPHEGPEPVVTPLSALWRTEDDEPSPEETSVSLQK